LEDGDSNAQRPRGDCGKWFTLAAIGSGTRRETAGSGRFGEAILIDCGKNLAEQQTNSRTDGHIGHAKESFSGRTERYKQYRGHSGLDGDNCRLAVGGCDNHCQKGGYGDPQQWDPVRQSQ
jgi:hypothetical protein